VKGWGERPGDGQRMPKRVFQMSPDLGRGPNCGRRTELRADLALNHRRRRSRCSNGICVPMKDLPDPAFRAKDARHPQRPRGHLRSEEHTSELQSPDHLVCRLLLEKKKE